MTGYERWRNELVCIDEVERVMGLIWVVKNFEFASIIAFERISPWFGRVYFGRKGIYSFSI